MNRSGLVILCSLLITLCIWTRSPAAEQQVSLTFAFQPFATPGGALTATLKRDRILRQALARIGYSLQFTPVSKGGEAIALLKSGSADISTLGDMPLIEASSKVPLTTIALIKQNYVSVVGNKGMFPGDLKGKRIGNSFGTTGHFALLKALASGGLTEGDVTLVPMEVTEMGEALLQNRIDAFSAWEPTPEVIISRHPDRFAAISRQKSLAFVTVSRRLADKSPETLHHLAAALVRAMNWLQKDKNAVDRAVDWNLADIRTLTGKPPLVTKLQLAQSIRKDLTAIGYSPRIPREVDSENSSLSEEARFLQKLGKISESTSSESKKLQLNFTVIDQVIKQSKQYQLNQFDYDRN